MNVLLTGACGFIGRHLAQRLAGSAHHVIGVCHRIPGTGTAYPPQTGNVQLHFGDLAAGLSTDADVDVIIHAAARTPAPGITVGDYVSSNILATQKLIDHGIEKGTKLLVYLSTVSIYGRVDSAIVNEETPVNQCTPYGMTKHIAELLLRDRETVLPSVTLRLPLVLGPGMKSGWLFETYQALLRHQPVHIYNGDSPYNMVHVSDVTGLILDVLGRSHEQNSVFTLSCDEPLTVRQIVMAMKQQVQSKSDITEEFIASKKGFRVSTEKARTLLGFRPTPAKEILARFLEEMEAGGRGGRP